jgi:phosphohistidine phosphatase SixA
MHRSRGARRLLTGLAGFVLLIAALPPGRAAEELRAEALLERLRGGGYNIYFRHASTDWGQGDQVEAAGDWTSCDPADMRQLSAKGRALAKDIGDAIRALGIPVAEVLSSEYCRAFETAELMNLGPVTQTRDVMNMRAAAYVGGRQAVIRHARRILSQAPPAGANTVIVGHGNLMRAATGAYAGEGGSGVYAPRSDGEAGFELVARLSADEWMRLARRFAGDG